MRGEFVSEYDFKSTHALTINMVNPTRVLSIVELVFEKK